MTNEASGTLTAEHSDSPLADNGVGMSAYEIAYLVKSRTGSAIRASLSALRLEPDLISDEILAVAASSLVARELVVLSGDELVANGSALAVIYALTSATRWTEIGLASSEGVDGAILIEAPLISLLCQPRMLGAWLVSIEGPDAGSAQTLRRLIDAQVALRPDGGVLLVSKSLENSATLLVQHSENGDWEVAAGATSTRAEIPTRGSTSAEIDAMLAELLAVTSQENEE